MAKNAIRQEQVQQQRLSQQNIQLFKLMELNLLQFDQKVKEELDINPALEDLDTTKFQETSSLIEQVNPDANFNADKYHLSSNKDDRHQGLEQKDHYRQEYNDQEDREYFIPVTDTDTLLSSLTQQLNYVNLTDTQQIIGEFIIGSLDNDGYLRRSIESIVDDLSFRQNLYTTPKEVEEVLEYVQDLDPAGIAARSLQECLALQLRRRKYNRLVEAALQIVTEYFDVYIKKQYEKIEKRLNLTKEDLTAIHKIILSLNPKPTEVKEDTIGKFIIPDFFVYRNENKLELELHNYNVPNLAINQDFVEMLKKIKADKKKSKSEQEAQDYIADKIQKASIFLTLIKERQETMIIVMNAILQLQKSFFLSGEEADLKPMTLKNISDITHFDVSTISRITSTKYVQTEFGIYSLKFLFSEGLMTSDGEEVSNRKIMKTIEDLVENEDKNNPFSDDEITQELEKLGFKIARRTAAKYRENLKIPSKHQRKLLLTK